jgi:hypothetical protein
MCVTSTHIQTFIIIHFIFPFFSKTPQFIYRCLFTLAHFIIFVMKTEAVSVSGKDLRHYNPVYVDRVAQSV